MRYFVVGDVHGHYFELLDALDRAGFNPNNPTHCLISCGDAIDRGHFSIALMDYLISLPNAILIRGNHEDMLEETLAEGKTIGKDENGTFATIRQLAEDNMDYSAGGANNFAELCRLASQHPVWQKYRNRLVDYYETEDYTFAQALVLLHTLQRVPFC